MKNVCLDLRGRMLRALVADGESVTFTRTYEQFSLDDAAQAGKAFAEISEAAGVRLDRVHLILPGEAASTEVFRLQNMSRSDAEKVIRRKIAQGHNAPSPLVQVLPAGTSGKQLLFLAETVRQEAVEAIIGIFRSHHIAVRTVSTPLQANRKALTRMHGDVSLVNAIFDVGNDFIDISVLHQENVIHYEKISLPPIDVEQELYNGVEMERIQKMRLYRIAEATYNFHLGYKQQYPDMPVRYLWICGSGGRLEGIRETLRESTGLDVATLNTLTGSAAGDGFLFTALHGMACGIADGTVVNYLPKEMTGMQFKAGRGAVLAAVCAYTVLLLAGYVLVELKYTREKSMLEEATKATRALEQRMRTGNPYERSADALKRLAAGEADYYPLFSYLAEATPAGVYIEGIALKRQAAATPLLDIDFVTPSHSGEIGGRKLLTNVVRMIDGFPSLKRRGEPGISITKTDKEKLVHFKIACEVRP